MAKEPKTAKGEDAGLEEAHFRIDELVRKLEKLEAMLPTADTVVTIATGAVAALGETVQRRIDDHTRSMEKEREGDRELAQAVRDLIRVISEQRTAAEADTRADMELSERVRGLTEMMERPSKRTATVNLPSGAVSVTVEERR